MDTRFWGEDGWKFLHFIAYCYEEDRQKDYINFFKSISHVLPCIYCRKSYKQYLKENPIDLTKEVLTKRDLTKWLYTIHNCVNEKLRKQGYKIEKDPTLKQVDDYYENSKMKCTTGFNFMYCILFNYHLDISNVRKKGYITFFKTLKNVLPTSKLRSIYHIYMDEYPFEEILEKVDREQSVEPVKKWIHKLEKLVKKCKPFQKSCEKIEKHRVSKCIGETCRNKIK